MNKFGMVCGLAAVATLAGCKDPDYMKGAASQNEPKTIETTPPATPIENDQATSTTTVVEQQQPKTPSVTADLSSKPATPVAKVDEEYTIYIVQKGDYLAKISKKFNVTISSIKRLNPSIKNDVVRLGQKLKLPGKLDVGVQEVPKAATVEGAKKSAKKTYAPYVGATKEYVVKSGDTLGGIAYGNGITIRQLKELNALSSDALKIGQKLKIPAEKVVKAAADKKTADDSAAQPKSASVLAVTEKMDKIDDTAKNDDSVKVEEAEKTAGEVAEKAAVVATPTYEVQEGDDITNISISWGVEPAQIRELNGLADGDPLVPGQIIKLPVGAQQQ